LSDEIKIEIFCSDEWEGFSNAYQTQTKKEPVYSDIDTLKNFVVVIFIGIGKLLDQHSLSDDKEKWSLFEFAMVKYEH
jgi:hypothetical protein